MKKQNNIIIIALLIILALLFLKYDTGTFSVISDFQNYNYSYTYVYSNYSMSVKSNQPLNISVWSTLHPDCDDSTTTSYLDNGQDSNKIAIKIQGRSSWDKEGCGGGNSWPATKKILTIDNLIINSKELSKLSFVVKSRPILEFGPNSQDTLQGFSKVYLSSSVKDILLYNLPSGNSDNVISIAKISDKILLQVNNGNSQIIDMDDKNYSLLLYSEIPSGYIGRSGQDIELDSISFETTGANNTFQTIVINNQTIVYKNQTIYQNQTVYQNQTITLTNPPSFIDKYGTAGIIFIVLGGIILWLLYKKK